jgi:WD40 repeat protein
MIPSKCIGVLKGRHKDEVWIVKFSPSGNRLASVGKDNMVYLWSLSKINSTNNNSINNLNSNNSSGTH